MYEAYSSRVLDALLGGIPEIRAHDGERLVEPRDVATSRPTP
jgi:hypothetical protein